MGKESGDVAGQQVGFLGRGEVTATGEERHLSSTQAASPAGESFSPYPSVCGRVDCCTALDVHPQMVASVNASGPSSQWWLNRAGLADI